MKTNIAYAIEEKIHQIIHLIFKISFNVLKTNYTRKETQHMISCNFSFLPIFEAIIDLLLACSIYVLFGEARHRYHEIQDNKT